MKSYSRIRKLTIPNNITRIADEDGTELSIEDIKQMFSLNNCGNLQEIVVEKGNSAFSIKNGFLVYKGILLYAIPSAIQADWTINLDGLADNAFENFDISQINKLNALTIDFDNNEKLLGNYQQKINWLNYENFYIYKLNLINYPNTHQFNLSLQNISTDFLSLSGDSANVRMVLASASNISINDGVQVASITLNEQQQNVQVDLPKSLQEIFVNCNQTTSYKVPYTHMEFEDKQMFRVLSLNNFEEVYSYKLGTLYNSLTTTNTYGNNIDIRFNDYTTNEEKIVKVFKDFAISEDYIDGEIKKVLTGYFGEEGEIYIPDQIGGVSVGKLILIEDGIQVDSNYKCANPRNYTTLSLPKTIKSIGYDSNVNLSTNYSFDTIEFRGTKAECVSIKSELNKLSDFVSTKNVLCENNEIFRLASKTYVNSTHTFVGDNVTYTFNADWTNNNYEIIMNQNGNIVRRHYISDDNATFMFDEYNNLYLDISTEIDGNYFSKQLVFSRSASSSDDEICFYDIKLESDSDKLVAENPTEFTGSIAHDVQEITILKATCSSAGESQIKCLYCDKKNGIIVSIPKLNHLTTNINTTGCCDRESCGEYLLGTKSGNKIIFAQNDDKQIYRNQVTTLNIPSDSEFTQFVFKSQVSSLFPNLTEVKVNSINDWLKCSFENANCNPLSKGLALKVKSATGNYEVLKNLVLDDSITTIPNYAFYGCTSIESIDLSSQSKSTYNTIGSQAFANLKNLTSISLKTFGSDISDDAFIDCTNLNSFENITSKNAKLYNTLCTNLGKTITCKNLYYNGMNNYQYGLDTFGEIDNVYLDSSIVSGFALNGQIKAKNVYVNSLSTWLDCYNYTDRQEQIISTNFNLFSLDGENYVQVKGVVTLPEITSINNASAFKANGLTHIVFPSTLSSDVSNILGDQITEVSAPAGVVQYLNISVNTLNVLKDKSTDTLSGAMNYSGSYNALVGRFAIVNLAKEIKTLQANLFKDSTTIKSINLDNVTTLNENVFNSSSIQNVGSISNLNAIPNYAFYSCKKLQTIDLGTIKSVGTSAFKDCSSLTLTNLNNLTTIWGYAFQNCGSIASLDLSNVTSNINASMFAETSIQELTLNTYVDIGTFPTKKLTIKSADSNGNITLSDVTTDGLEIHLPANTTTFANKKSNNSITLGKDWIVYFGGNLNSLASATFTNISVSKLFAEEREVAGEIELSNLSFIGTIFQGLNTITSLKLNNIQNIDSSFKNCTGLNSVTITNTSSNTINLGQAFAGCTNLKTVKLSGDFGTIRGSFKDCSSLTTFECDGTGTIDDYTTFQNCTKLTTFVAPKLLSSANANLLSGVGTLAKFEVNADFVNNQNYGYTVQNFVLHKSNKSNADTSTSNNIVVLDSFEAKAEITSASIVSLKGNIISNITLPASFGLKDSIKDYLGSTSQINFNCNINDYASKNYSFSLFEKTKNIYILVDDQLVAFPSVIELNSITSIGKNAFANADFVTKLTIPSSCSSIDTTALKNMSSLKELSIPDNCEFVLTGVLAGCTSLQTISIPSSNFALYQLFGNEKTLPTSLKNVTIRAWGEVDGKKTIPTSMFEGCKGITFTYPTDYAVIGSYAFKDSDITSFNISDTCVSIGTSAFENTALTEIVIPDNCLTIGDSAFQGCSKLTSVSFNGFSKSKTLGKLAFNGATAIKNTYVTTLDNTHNICSTKWVSSVFDFNKYDCTLESGTCNPVYYSKNLILNGQNVTSVVYNADSSDNTQISGFAFVNLDSIETISLSNVSEVGSFAFYNCYKIQTLNVNTTGKIGAFAFAIEQDKTSLLESINLVSGSDISSDALNNHTSNITEAIVINQNTSNFDGLLDGATKLWKAEIGSLNGYKFNENFASLQYLTYRVYETKTMSLNSGFKVSAPNIKSISFVGSGTLSIGSGAFTNVSKLYRLQFGDMSNSNQLKINNIESNAFDRNIQNTGTNETRLYELYNSTNYTFPSSTGSFFVADNVATRPSESKLIVSQDWEGVYFNHSDESYFELVDFREDNKTSYTFNDTISSVISEWDGSTISLGTIKVFGNRLFGREYLQNNTYITRNRYIKDLIISPRIASETNFGYSAFGNLNSVTYSEGTTSIVGFGLLNRSAGKIDSIVLPSTLKEIKQYAFFGATIDSITFANNATSNIQTIGTSAFANCSFASNNIDNILLSVTGLGDGAFSNTNITSITIPSTLTEIPNYAFQNCTSLSSITGLNNVTAIYRNAFSSSAITSVTLGELTTFSKTAFEDCAQLTSVHFDSLAYGTGSSIDSVTAKWFKGCVALKTITSTADETSTGYFAKGNSLYVKQTDSITLLRATNGSSFVNSNSAIVEFNSIAEYAFSWLDGSVKEFTLPTSLTKIESNAFASSLVEKLVLDNVKTIENNAFANSSIKTITTSDNLDFVGIKLSQTLTTLGVQAFFECLNISNVVLPDSLKILQNGTFAGSNLSTITFGNAVTDIGDSAFARCLNLSSIIIPSTIVNLGYNTFISSGLTSVEFAENCKLETLNTGVFAGTNLETITLPSTLNTIANKSSENEKGAFEDCQKLQSVNASGLVNIGAYSFNNCAKLLSIVSDKIKYISNDAFVGCVMLNNINLANAIEIKDRAFKGTKLSTIDLSAIETIGESAFEDCAELTSYTLGTNSSWKSVGSYAFKNTALSGTITLGSKLTTIGENIFENIGDVTKFVTPYLSKDETHLKLSYFFGKKLSSLDTLEITGIYKDTSVVDTTIDYVDFEDTNIDKLILSTYIKNIVDTGTTKYIRLNENQEYVHTFSELRYAGSLKEWAVVTHEIEVAPAQITTSIYCGDTLLAGDVSISAIKITKGKFYKYNQKMTLTLSNVEVEQSAFEGSNVTSLTISDSKVFANAFRNTKLVSLNSTSTTLENKNTFLDTVQTEYGKQFANNQYLTQAKVNIKNMNSTYAFANCANLKTITYSDTVNSFGLEIPEGTFMDCPSIESLTLPTNVSAIGKYAFKNNTGLKDVTIKFDVFELNTNTYLNDAPLEICAEAFAGCSSLNELTFDGVWGYVDPTGENSKLHSSWSYTESNGRRYLSRENETPTNFSSLIAFRERAFLDCKNLQKVNYIVTSSSSTGYTIFKPSADILWSQNFFEFDVGNVETGGTTGIDDYYKSLTDLPSSDEVLQRKLSANPLAYGGLLYIKNVNNNELQQVTEITENNYSGHTEWAGSGITSVNIAGDTCERDSMFAFANCKSLTSFTSKNLYYLGTKLRGCTSLNQITLTQTQIDKGVKIKTYSEGNYIVYQTTTDTSYKAKNCLWYVKGDTYDDTNLNIDVIQRFAFANSDVKNVILNNPKAIDAYAFAYSNVETLTINSTEFTGFNIISACGEKPSSLNLENNTLTLEDATLSIFKNPKNAFISFSSSFFTYRNWL